MKICRLALFALSLVIPAASHAETKDEWIALGARVHGGFGPFIPVGIRIGLDAMQRLKADRHDLTILYYDGGLPPCPCVLRYTIAREWHPKILAWRTDLDPSGRYDAGMNAEGLFSVEPAEWPPGIDAR